MREKDCPVEVLEFKGATFVVILSLFTYHPPRHRHGLLLGAERGTLCHRIQQ